MIFATRYDKKIGETTSVCEGMGDYYARLGLASTWVKRQEHYNSTYEADKED